jgi:transcriptional regulator with PAS, ATPase and Fis domain
MAAFKQKLRRLARSDLDLLLVGETGVGKEVYAQAIHRASGRAGRFVAINCAALPDNLVESELFGYARGAHSTAGLSKPGLLETAQGGTVFLDEIAEMPATAQAKLLRFLQDRSFTPLGATKPVELDVRVLAATNQPLGDGGSPSSLRPDLRARLGPQPFLVPPLRTRVEEVGALVSYFLHGRPLEFEPHTYRALFLHTWPGNVRELEKVTSMMAALSGTGLVTLESLPDEMVRKTAPRPVSGARTTARVNRPTPSRVELARLLELHDGDVAQVARSLGRQRSLVWRWLRKCGVDPRLFRVREAGT